MSVFKKYDETNGKFGRVAEQAIHNWLINNKYTVTPLPHGKYKWDCLAESETEKAYVEVERRGSWKSGAFSFPTVHVPVRRYKSGDAWLFIVRCDLNAALVAFFKNFLVSNRVEVPNKFVEAGEEFFDIPIEWCLPIDMNDHSGKTIAERNRQRIVNLLQESRTRGCSVDYCKVILGPLAPYGMCDAEWNNLLVECNTDELAEQRKPRDVQGTLFY